MTFGIACLNVCPWSWIGWSLDVIVVVGVVSIFAGLSAVPPIVFVVLTFPRRSSFVGIGGTFFVDGRTSWRTIVV